MLVDYCCVCFFHAHRYSFAGSFRKLIGERFVRFASAASSITLNGLCTGLFKCLLNVCLAIPVSLAASAIVYPDFSNAFCTLNDVFFEYVS